MKKNKRPFGKILMILMIAFFYLPIIYMVVFSFNESKSLTSFTGFSLRWYEHMLESSDMMTALYTTFSVAILATLISTFVGTIAAIGLSSSRKIIRNIMEQVDNLPMMNPEIVTAIGFMLLFITFQVEKGYVTMLLAHIAFCIPYVILSVMPKIRALDPNLADVAMDLGATPWKALTKVIVPQITPGIVSGALIAFTMSVDDFIISYFVTGQGVKNLSIVVYTMSKRVNPSINAVSTLVVVIITIVLLIVNIAPLVAAKKNARSELGRRKKFVPAAAGCLVAVIAVLAVYQGRPGSADRPFEGQTLHIYNWGEYTGENIIPDFEEETGAKAVALSYEYDPCDYLKAQEFQQKRDIEGFKKSPADDLKNMQTGIFGYKGRICFRMADCLDDWLNTLPADMPKTEFFATVAARIDREIHRNYELYPGNYAAADLLRGTERFADRYTADEKAAFEAYLQGQIRKVSLPNPDTAFLRERLLTMYANPVFNHETAIHED